MLLVCISSVAQAAEGCLTCHEGIERFTDGPMIEQIEVMGEDYGDPGGCVICHGGTPSATTPEEAHKAKRSAGSGSRTDTQVYSLANSWDYATGTYSATITYTLTVP